MATLKVEEDWEPALVSSNDVILEDIVSRYEVTVYTLAMHLTGDETSAKKVVLDVFIRYAHQAHKHLEESLDSLIHRYTYDAALPCLLGLLESQLDETEELALLMGSDDGEKLHYC
jgi:hypothetical protein